MKKSTVVIGISGASASGKTVLTADIASAFDSTQVGVISEDSYYKNLSHLEPEKRAKVNFDHPEAFDHQYLAEHLQMLKNGLPIEVPTYDYTINTRSAQVHKLLPAKVIIVEGILLFSDPILHPLLDIKVFLDTPLDLCLLRRIKRDIIERGRTLESVTQKYESQVRPMFHKFIEPSRQYADIIVPNTKKNYIAVDLIKTKVHQILG